MSERASMNVETASVAAHERWVSRPRPNADAALRLFCFPYAGGRAAIYRSWPDFLPASVEVCAIEPPGHGARLREPPVARLDSLVERLAAAAEPYLDRPFAFFGHSLGALVAFELTRHLRRLGRPMPVHLFVSGGAPPHLGVRASVRRLHDLPEDELVRMLRLFNGTPREVLEHAELMQIMLPVLRADFALGETHSYVPEPPLGCPIAAFGGTGDGYVNRRRLESWRDLTTGAFSLWMVPGDHFFIHTNQLLLLTILGRELRTELARIV